MMDLKTILNHDRYKIIATLLTTLVLIFVYSCDARVRSLTNPTMKVNRTELKNELDTIIATAEVRFADLDRQDELRQTLFEHTALWASTGVINPIGLLLALGTIFGVGATADNIRTRNTIKKGNGS